MHWKRRRPKWLYLSILVFLFGLTLVAPESWRRHPPSKSAVSEPTAIETIEDEPWEPSSPLAEPIPTLPPLAQRTVLIDDPTFASPDVCETAPTAPVVASDDYVVVDEPFVELADQETREITEPSDVDDAGPQDDAPPSAVAESFAQRTAARSVLVKTVQAPTSEMHTVISVASLVRARDALVEFIAELQKFDLPAPEPPKPATPARLRVVVESESDRLAMAPDLADSPSPIFAEAPFDGPEPILAEAAPLTEALPIKGDSEAEQNGGLTAALRHRPVTLIEQLQAIDPNSSAGSWAAEVLVHLEELTEPSPEQDWSPNLRDLRQLADDGFSEALNHADAETQSAWIRASRSLDRRLPVWELLLETRGSGASMFETPQANEAAIAAAIRAAAAAMAGKPEGPGWRSYLRLDDLIGLTSVGGDDHEEVRRAAARQVLWRMVDPNLTPEQQQFLTEPVFAAVARELRPWASGPISIDALASLVERYEQTSSRRDADLIAELRLRMKWHDDQRLNALADQLNQRYRNGNFRLAVSNKFLNRLIPEQQPVVAPVRDQIQGAQVHGRSRTHTQLHVRLLPDPRVWRFGLEVRGTVRAQTYSDTWPARVRNSSRMNYEARKLIMINRYGLHLWPAEARAFGRNELVGVDTELDPVPLVGTLMQSVVVETHRQTKDAAMAEVKAKIRRQARERMDREAAEKLARVEQRYRQNLAEPLARFGLMFEPLDMSTTEQRAVMRVRAGDDQQLAAHTPRPSAPSDSAASVQLHESAVNNAMRGLELDGRRLTVSELDSLLSQKIPRRKALPAQEAPRRATVEFAEDDAVRIRCSEDRIELVLSIIELRQGRDRIRNVKVHAFFRPEIEGLDVKLVRDGTLQFEGAHLRTGPRMVLHGVFNKILRPNQEFAVLAGKLNQDPRFAGLMVTQLVIDDGWLAMSLGPATPDRTAWRTRSSAIR